jgi:hypothetical protein
MTTQIKSFTDHVELSLLNIDGSKDPSLYNFPTKFSTAGRRIWAELLKSPQYAKAKLSFKSRDDDWTWVLRAYLTLCNKAGVMPFKGSTEQSKVDAVTAFLTVARRRAIKFMDDIGFFERTKLFLTSREYGILPDRFVVITRAQLRPIQDPTFTNWLCSHPPGPLFRTTGHAGQYVKNLFNNIDSGVTFEFNGIYMVRPTLTMIMQCETPIAYGHTRSIATEQAAREYAESTIWLPLVRSHRFRNATNRLF